MTIPRRSPCRLAALLCIIALSSLPTPTTAIGGWETIHIFFRRISGERSQTQQHQQNLSNMSGPKKMITPMSSSDQEDGVEINPIGGTGGGRSGGRRGGNKESHVGEVTMTSMSRRSKVDECSDGADAVPSVGGVRGRRGFGLDEKDLATITFVGRSPFL